MNKTTSFQLLVLRVIVALPFLPYAVQQLFEGSVVRSQVAHVYNQLGIPSPQWMVWFVGVSMLLAFLGLFLGFLTRFSSVLSFVFLITAIYWGHHNAAGYFWFYPGGGWEYLAFWAVLCLSFACFGANSDYSMDAMLIKRVSHVKALGFLSVLFS